MKMDPGLSDELVDLVKNVSDSIPDKGENLLREDTESLRRYIGSQAFLDELMNEDSTLEIDSEIFFLILFHQLRRKFHDDKDFREDFVLSAESTSDTSWDEETIRSYLNDDELTIYLVSMLDKFVDAERVHQIPSFDDEEFHYVFEMIEASQKSSDTESYQIFCHIGNYSLYLTGIFPDWIRYRHERKNRPMDVNDYSDYGKTYFKKAARHRLAKKKKMEPVLKKLSRGYDLARAGLELLFKRLVPSFQQ